MNDLIQVIATLFLIREKDAAQRKEFAAAVAYANAYDLLCYAVHDRDDCLCQFDGYDEANRFLNAHPNVDVWDLEEIFKQL